MKVLILSCNTGGGHNAAAQAIAEAIREHGDCAEVLDYLSLAGNGVSKLVGDGYVKVVKKAPAMFGVAYKLGMVVSRLMKKSPVYYANARMAHYLEEYLQENPVDAIVMPHLYPGRNDYLYAKKWVCFAAYGGRDDRLHLYPVLGRNRLRLLYYTA